jgi:hypothetical protein
LSNPGHVAGFLPSTVLLRPLPPSCCCTN